MRRVTRLTGATRLDENTALGPGLCQIEEMRFHLENPGAVPGELFTITIDSAAAAVYDTVLFSQDMDSVQDVHWLPVRPILVLPGDELTLLFPNAADDNYGLEIVWSGLGV